MKQLKATMSTHVDCRCIDIVRGESRIKEIRQSLNQIKSNKSKWKELHYFHGESSKTGIPYVKCWLLLNGQRFKNRIK